MYTRSSHNQRYRNRKSNPPPCVIQGINEALVFYEFQKSVILKKIYEMIRGQASLTTGLVNTCGDFDST